MEAAISNMVMAMPDGPWLRDVAKAVCNDPSPDSAAQWVLGQAGRWIGTDDPIKAYDSIIYDVEALNRIWPLAHHAAELMPVEAASILPALARFVFERIPAVRAEAAAGVFVTDNPLTQVLVIAERVHDLVGLFAVGLKPNGSKDPYALRRMAKHLLWCILPYLSAGELKGAFA